jgi:hypothetical protein
MLKGPGGCQVAGRPSAPEPSSDAFKSTLPGPQQALRFDYGQGVDTETP